MKRRRLIRLPLYLSLMLAVLSFMMTPPVLASRTANCGGGRTVACTAFRCICQDNIGCTGYDAQDRVVEDKPCPSRAIIDEVPVE